MIKIKIYNEDNLENEKESVFNEPYRSISIALLNLEEVVIKLEKETGNKIINIPKLKEELIQIIKKEAQKYNKG